MKNHFLVVLLVVLGLTVFFGLLATILAILYPNPTPILEKIIDNSWSLVMLGSGAMFTLMKSRPDR